MEETVEDHRMTDRLWAFASAAFLVTAVYGIVVNAERIAIGGLTIAGLIALYGGLRKDVE